MRLALYLFSLLLFCFCAPAQVYSPKVLRDGQPDSTDLQKFTATIYAHADANTPREKAEAIWRFFLTDGRFVKPGFWYHIAGWAYEEPTGEVLDPIKLLNSYGFGLCYHIAPLLQAVFQAGGFADARTWFLTGHTVTEVFYDGSYHYFDSDMMGYNVPGDGSFRGKRVASVRDLERNPEIILGKLENPKTVKPGVVDAPWYPADVRASAMGDLAGLFTSTGDNYLYPFTRYSPGHTMDFTLRPGEKLIRFFKPEQPGLFYLPYKFDGKQWTEFPQEFSEYQIRTVDGPRSQKDDRLWATGRIEYDPLATTGVISMPSPYVIIDASFRVGAELPSPADSVRFETSTDNGRTWEAAGELKGPHHGVWTTEPRVLAKSAHGRLTAVSGSYGYTVRITSSGDAALTPNSLHLVSRIQLNPRSLPAIQSGENGFDYSAGPAQQRVEIAAPLDHAPLRNMECVTEAGQSLLRPLPNATGEVVYELNSDSGPLTGFDVGARVLDTRNGLAPDKLTAETRRTKVITASGSASIEWSLSPDGPFQKLWNYPAKIEWRDGDPIDRLLLWPEVLKQVRDVPPNTAHVYVKLRTTGPAIDSIRLATYSMAPPPAGSVLITQVWSENGTHREHTEKLPASIGEKHWTVHGGAGVANEAVILSVPPL